MLATQLKLKLTWSHFLRKVEVLRIQLRIQQGDGDLHGGLHPGRGVPHHGKHDEERGEGRGGERRLSCIQHIQPCCSRTPACGWGTGQCVRTRKPEECGGPDGGRGGLAGIGHIHRHYQTRARTPWRSHGGCQPTAGF